MLTLLYANKLRDRDKENQIVNTHINQFRALCHLKIDYLNNL